MGGSGVVSEDWRMIRSPPCSLPHSPNLGSSSDKSAQTWISFDHVLVAALRRWMQLAFWSLSVKGSRKNILNLFARVCRCLVITKKAAMLTEYWQRVDTGQVLGGFALHSNTDCQLLLLLPTDPSLFYCWFFERSFYMNFFNSKAWWRHDQLGLYHPEKSTRWCHKHSSRWLIFLALLRMRTAP